MRIVKSGVVLVYMYAAVLSFGTGADQVKDERITSQEVRDFVRITVKGRWPDLQDDRTIRLENYWVKVIEGIQPAKRQRKFVREQIKHYFFELGADMHQEHGITVIGTIEKEINEHIDALNTYPGNQMASVFVKKQISRQKYICDILMNIVTQADSIAIEYGGNDVGRLWYDVQHAEWPRMIGKGFGSDEIERTENKYAYDSLLAMIRRILERNMADMEIYAYTAYYDAFTYNYQSSKWISWKHHNTLIDREIVSLTRTPLVLSDHSQMASTLFLLRNSMVGFGEKGDHGIQAIHEFRRHLKQMQASFEDKPENYVVFRKDGSGPFRLGTNGWEIINAKGELIEGSIIGRMSITAAPGIRRLTGASKNEPVKND